MLRHKFIEEWIKLSISQVPITINSIKDINKIRILPDNNIISTYKDWAYSKNCLFYKNIPYCYKINKMFIVNMSYQKDYVKMLNAAFVNTSSRCYLFEDFDFHPTITRVVKHFEEKSWWCDPVLIQAIIDLNIVFSDKSINDYIKKKINYWKDKGEQFYN